MKKIMIILFAFAVVASGCNPDTGNEDTTNGDNAAGEGQEPIELTWMVRSNPAMMPWHEQMIEEFEAENSNITIELQVIPQEEIDQRLATMIAGGNIPDIWSSAWTNSGFVTYQDMEAHLDLTPYIEQDPEVIEGLDEDLLAIHNVDGKQYGLPMLSYGTYLFYNQDIFDEEGVDYPTTDWDDTSWTWEAMVDKAKQLTRDIGDPNNQVFGFNYAFQATKRAWLFGGDFFEPETYEDGIMRPQVLEDPQVEESFQAAYDLVHTHEVAPNPSQLDAVEQLGDPFLTGKIAMTINGGWSLQNYQEAEFNFGVAAQPFGHEDRQVSLHVDPWNIGANTEHPDEAWEFIKFITDPEGGARELMELTLTTPANSNLLDDWYALVSERLNVPVEELQDVHEGALEYGRKADDHSILHFNNINNTIEQTAQAIYSGSVDVETGLEDIDHNLRALDLE